MKLLALDTATERCSVALLMDERVIERSVDTARGHAEIILPMVDEVLNEACVELAALDGLAFGRGPGAFTGLRIAAGVVQGLALGSGLPVVPVSDLAALAFAHTTPGERALAAIDARMGEVYWAVYERGTAETLRASTPERVTAPDAVAFDGSVAVCAGTGFRAYPALARRFAPARILAAALPAAGAVAILGAAAFRRGEARSAAEALPVYLRDEIVQRR